jgi:signal transduction histidine kinase
MLVIWGWLLETVLAMVSTERFSVVWYTGRIAALCSGLLVLVMLLIEITRLYGRLAQMVTARNRERAQRSLTMNAVAAAMAHEIKQPLASIVANAGAGAASLRRDSLDMNLIGELFDSIERDGMTAGGVVDSIRAMFAQHPIQRTRLDVNELVQEALAMIRREADASGVTLLVQPVSGSLAVSGDHLQLIHLLLNLLVNGIEAMKPVTDRARLLRIDAERRDGQVLVAISDNGIGIPATQMERLFEPFYTTKPQGTGMGLPLCRSILDLHGGRIWAAAGVDHGAVLRFSLPAVP